MGPPDRFRSVIRNLQFVNCGAEGKGRRAGVTEVTAPARDLPPSTHPYAEVIAIADKNRKVLRNYFEKLSKL
jgi:hypothetical protein